MRKSVLLIMMLFAVSMAANAQKFALIDTEYIMKNIPAAQSANEQMQEATKKYQSEVEALAKEARRCSKITRQNLPLFLPHKNKDRRCNRSEGKRSSRAEA